MKGEILKAVYDGFHFSSFMTAKDIEKIVEIIIRYKQLEGYISDLKIIGDKDDVSTTHLANYGLFDKKLTININRCKNYASKYVSNFNDLLTDKEQVFFSNLIITRILLHESEHACQNKKFDADKTDLESLLIKYCLDDIKKLKQLEPLLHFNDKNTTDEIANLLREQKKLYNRCYKYTPTERLADIKSFEEIVSIVSLMKRPMPRLQSISSINLIASLLSGYEIRDGKLYSPTLTYIKNKKSLNNSSISPENVNMEGIISTLQSQYTLRQRLSFGLPISQDEYIYVKKMIN